jgi:hypothetical protein
MSGKHIRQKLRDAYILEQANGRVRLKRDQDIDVATLGCLPPCDRAKKARMQNTPLAEFQFMST